jgi:3-hydroxymyristoyl/3-hydroxydecanoyl-(acyl carrier protein) dehydratase
VIPGDQLFLEIILVKRRQNLIKMAGKATVEETLVTEAEIMAVTGDKL